MNSVRDFMCICSEEEKAKCDELMERVTKELSTDTEGKEVFTSSMDLLEACVWDLGWNTPDGFAASIEGFDCDQWCAVSGNVRRYDKEAKKWVDHASIYVQCDRIMHGVARVWELCKEQCK